MKYQIKKWRVLFWVTAVAILYLGVKSTPNTQLFPEADKFYHWLAFSALTLTGHMAFRRLPLATLAAAVITVSACIELLQILSPDRTTSLADLTVNIVGVLTGLAAIQFVHGEEQRVAQAQPHGKRHKRRHHRHRRPREEYQAQEEYAADQVEAGYVLDKGH